MLHGRVCAVLRQKLAARGTCSKGFDQPQKEKTTPTHPTHTPYLRRLQYELYIHSIELWSCGEKEGHGYPRKEPRFLYGPVSAGTSSNASLTGLWNYGTTPVLGAGEFSSAQHRQKRDKQSKASCYGHRDGKTSFQIIQEDGRWGGLNGTGPARQKNQRSSIQLGGTPC